MREERYLLLCRHARHDDGELVAVKGDDEVWRFPTDSVARALVEQVAFGDDGLCLAKVLYAPTHEAERTAALLLRRLGGMSTSGATNRPRAGTVASRPAVAWWRWRSTSEGWSGEGTKAAEKRPPPQPTLPEAPVTIAKPPWLDETDWQERLRAGNYDGKIEHAKASALLPNRFDQLSAAETLIQGAIGDLGKRGHALLVVGHQPQLSCLSERFMRRRLSWLRRAVPIASSEVVCLRLERTGWRSNHKKWRGRLMWTLADDDRAALEQVADKVKGKMESAKLLSAVITLMLTALLAVLLDPKRWDALAGTDGDPVRASLSRWSYSGQAAAQVAFATLLAALALYMLTMYAYDRLLMPTRFWAERRRERVKWSDVIRPWQLRPRTAWLPQRPPSSSAWVVYRNMQRIWFCLFTPANVLVALAVVVLASALLRIHGATWVPVVAVLVAVAAWRWWFRPVLGSED